MPTHAEKRHLPFSCKQLYALVRDVKCYPEFLPWCVGARILRDEEKEIVAELTIGYKIFRERFTSHVILSDNRIDVSYTEGPFKYLNNHWIFEEADNDTCIIDFYVDFEFRSSFLQNIIQLFFEEAVKRMITAFEDRAKTLYKKD